LFLGFSFFLIAGSCEAGILDRCRDFLSSLVGGSIASTDQREPKTLQPEEITRLIERILETPTAGVSLVGISDASVTEVVDMTRKRLNKKGFRVVEVVGNAPSPSENIRGLYDRLVEAFPHAASPGKDLSNENETLLDALGKILDAEEAGITEQTPLVIFVSDLRSTVPSFNEFTSWLRALHNSRVLNAKFDRVHIVIVSRQSSSEWGAAQGGFNVGEHILP